VTTKINITIESGGLTDKVKQQQQASRQAQLEKERQQRIETEGTNQRTAKLKAEGKAPDGSPLNGPKFKQPQIDRRPAANRNGVFPLVWYFQSAPNPTEQGRYDSNYAINQTYKLRGSALIPATEVVSGELVPVYNFLAAESQRSFTFVPGTPENSILGQNSIEFPIITDDANRVEWTNFNGQLTAFNGTSSLVRIRKPRNPAFTLEFDFLIGPSVSAVSSRVGAQVRLFSSATAAATSPADTFIDFELSGFSGRLTATRNVFEPNEIYFEQLFWPNQTNELYPEPTEGDNPTIEFFWAGRVWRRYSLTITSNQVLLHVDGIYKQRLILDPAILSNFRGVGWIVDGNAEDVMPSVSAVRFTERALYTTEAYTVESLLVF